MILAIETSCDDTSIAILDEAGFVLALSSAHQDLAHRPFGGVVPEVASREHTEQILPLIEQTLEKARVSWPKIKALAVTSRPGLIGSLLVGVVTAKTLALWRQIPLFGINHIEGHLLAPLLKDSEYQPESGFSFPYLGLAVSGGHTHLFHVEALGRYKLLGQTLDDAAGEAFDKLAKMLKLGFPGGVRVDKLAQTGNPEAFTFPRALLNQDDLNFSFSGLKSSAARLLESLGPQQVEKQKADICASFQQAIVDVLVEKLLRASHQTGLTNWTVTGGVSANSQLRQAVSVKAQEKQATLALPPLRYCTDNAAMIGLAGLYRFQAGQSSDLQLSLSLSPQASSLPSDWLN